MNKMDKKIMGKKSTIEHHSALKTNELLRHEKTWRNLTCILLSEKSQSEKADYCLISTI